MDRLPCKHFRMLESQQKLSVFATSSVKKETNQWVKNFRLYLGNHISLFHISSHTILPLLNFFAPSNLMTSRVPSEYSSMQDLLRVLAYEFMLSTLPYFSGRNRRAVIGSDMLYTHCLKDTSYVKWGTWWRSWLRHWATSRKFAGSIPDGVIFHWHNPSGRTMALGLTQPPTEMITSYISLGVKAADA